MLVEFLVLVFADVALRTSPDGLHGTQGLFSNHALFFCAFLGFATLVTLNLLAFHFHSDRIRYEIVILTYDGFENALRGVVFQAILRVLLLQVKSHASARLSTLRFFERIAVAAFGLPACCLLLSGPTRHKRDSAGNHER